MEPAARYRAPDSRRDAADHLLAGRMELRRVGRWRFPVHELVHADNPIARLGRLGWLRIYLGPGVRVELADGARWRIRSATIGGYICPLVADDQRRKIAVGTPGIGNYGIAGRDQGYGLYPGLRPRRPDAEWILRQHDSDVAVVRRRPLCLDAAQPVHLGAVLLSFVIVRYGVPDDARPRLPSFRWR